MLDEIEKPNDFPLPNGRCEYLFQSSSYYFGVTEPVSKMWLDDGHWQLSTRSSINNYGGEIEIFLRWIKPYIESGSGCRNMYAIVTYEEAAEPTIYYLYE